jgi:hypothetical protein
VLFIEAHNADDGPVEGGGYFREILAIIEAVFALQWIVIGKEPVERLVPPLDNNAARLGISRWKIRLDDVAAAIEKPAVDDEIAFRVDNPSTDSRVGKQAAQHGAGGFGIDRKIKAAELVGVRCIGVRGVFK